MGLECRGVSQDCYKPVLREKAAPKLTQPRKKCCYVPEVVAKKNAAWAIYKNWTSASGFYRKE